MDMSCRNGSMACCDRDLMQVGNRVPGGIEPLNRTALMLVNFKHPTSVVAAPSAEARSERTSQPSAG
jgi:hypothetical protein